MSSASELVASPVSRRPRASFKAKPEDFVVEEIPSYEPSGKGDHVYVRFEKRALNTDEAARSIARGAGANPRDSGIAGLKDRAGVTTQQISLFLPEKQHPDLAKISALEIPGVRILSVSRHGNKLKTGHLRGNRFAITLRDIEPSAIDGVKARLERAAIEGVPNAYGKQRFGRDDDNDTRALAWLSGDAPPPRDPRARRFAFSALQSRAFNEVLDARVANDTWKTPIEGDVLVVHASGGVFASEDLAAETERAAKGEISPTGPMPGASMKPPHGAAAALEGAIVEKVFGPAFDFEKHRALGEGTRRALRVMVDSLRAEIDAEQSGVLRVTFVLPKGAYATTVLACAIEAEEPGKTSAPDELASSREHMSE